MKKFVLCLTAVLFGRRHRPCRICAQKNTSELLHSRPGTGTAEKLPPFPEPAEEPDNGEEIHYVIPAQTPSPPPEKLPAVVVDHETPPEKVHVNFLQTS